MFELKNQLRNRLPEIARTAERAKKEQIAFKGKRLTTDSADDGDKRRNPSVKSA